MSEGPVTYEVNLVPDPEIEEAFDEWLDGHVIEMLRLPGFLTAVVRRAEDSTGDRTQRTVQYELRDREALDAYLGTHAAAMRQQGIDRFGDRFTATRRILDRGHRLSAGGTGGGCANCEAPLTGQYCAVCGQRARARMITVWQLLKEVSEVLTTLDSRLWRTVTTLLFRPGRLTDDYLKGRRARYSPPLRLFLGASIVFFFALAVGERLDLDGGVTVQVGDGEEVVLADLEGLTDDEKAALSNLEGLTDEEKAILSDLEGRADEEQDAGRGSAPGEEAVTASGPAPDTAPDDSADADAGEEDPCGDIDIDLGSDDAWLAAYLNEERVEAICRKVVDDHGASFGRALLDNIPIMMFLFLPLMAVVMKVLYLFTGRYYVEHLLFLVHYHAFFYLLLTLAVITGWVFNGRALPDWPAQVAAVGVSVYVPYYLYRGMRVVYAQGRAMTVFKYFGLGLAYFVALLVMFVLTAAVTAFTL